MAKGLENMLELRHMLLSRENQWGNNRVEDHEHAGKHRVHYDMKGKGIDSLLEEIGKDSKGEDSG